MSVYSSTLSTWRVVKQTMVMTMEMTVKLSYRAKRASSTKLSVGPQASHHVRLGSGMDQREKLAGVLICPHGSDAGSPWAKIQPCLCPDGDDRAIDAGAGGAIVNRSV